MCVYHHGEFGRPVIIIIVPRLTHSQTYKHQNLIKNMLVCCGKFGRLFFFHLHIYRPTPMMVHQNAHICMLKLMLLLRGKTKFQSLVPLQIQTIMYMLYWNNHQIRFRCLITYIHSYTCNLLRQ